MKDKIKILKSLIILFLIVIIIIIFNSNIGLFQSYDFIFLKIFRKKNNKQDNIYNIPNQQSYIFNVDLKNIDIKSVNLIETVDKNTCINEKIAPGTSGNFSICLQSNKNSKYKINFQSVNEKPQNLYFKALKNKKEIAEAETLEKLSEKLEGNINKKEKIKIDIQWYWNFENGKESTDIQDTQDAKKIRKYQFDVYALGEEI